MKQKKRVSNASLASGLSVTGRSRSRSGRTPDGLQAHGFTTLVADLTALTLNEVAFPGNPDHANALRAVQSCAP